MTTDQDTADAAGATHSVIVPEEQAGRRIDAALAALLPPLSRSRIKNLIQDGCVQADDVPILSPAHKASLGAAIDVDIPALAEAALAPEPIPLHILYEDGHLLVVNKPAGLIVHPGAGNPSGTLVNALLAHCGPDFKGIGGVRRPGIVHRIDKDTSGLLVVAKTQPVHAALVERFAAHDIHRRYLALTIGVPSPSRGTISTMIGRAPTDRKRMAVLPEGKGKPAVTHYTVLQTWRGRAARVECRLETGRTHQIRVHMAHSGTPLIGDQTYTRWTKERRRAFAGDVLETVMAFPRQALHAAELGFVHPVTGDDLRFSADPPADFTDLMRTLDIAGR